MEFFPQKLKDYFLWLIIKQSIEKHVHEALASVTDTGWLQWNYFDLCWYSVIKDIEKMLFSHTEIKVFYITTPESQLLFLLPKYQMLIASYLCFLEGLINTVTTSLRKTIYVYILCLTGWKHSSGKQLSRHDDNKPSVARMVGKEVALSKQYFPKKSRAICQAVVHLDIYFRYFRYLFQIFILHKKP